MSLVTLTPERISTLVGESVPELYVVIAKNSVMDMDSKSLIGLLGITAEDLHEIETSDLYKQVRLLVASEHAKDLVEVDSSWDSLEQMALKNLTERMQANRDPEFALKVAAVANRAQRRIKDMGNRVLDPSQTAVRVPLRLTERITKRINSVTGDETQERVREISVIDGTAVNPRFEDIDLILGGSEVKVREEPKPVAVTDGDFEALAASWTESLKGVKHGRIV